MMALDLCGFSAGTDAYRDNYRAFASVMMRLGMKLWGGTPLTVVILGWNTKDLPRY